jgi:ABC-type transporter Mla MlaB component
MLRIWTEETKNGTRGLCLRLEGQVRGPWVAELARATGEVVARGVALSLDLGGVSFVDADGVALLRNLQSQQIPFENCTPFTAAQLRS